MDERQLHSLLAGGAGLDEYLNPVAESRESALVRRLRWARVNQYDYANKKEAKFLVTNKSRLMEIVRQRDFDNPLLEKMGSRAVAAAPNMLRSFMHSAPQRTPEPTPRRPASAPAAPAPTPTPAQPTPTFSRQPITPPPSSSGPRPILEKLRPPPQLVRKAPKITPPPAYPSRSLDQRLTPPLPRPPPPAPRRSEKKRDSEFLSTPPPVRRRRSDEWRIEPEDVPATHCFSCSADIRGKLSYMAPSGDAWLCRDCAVAPPA